MALNTAALIDALASHAMTLGVFERVNLHEPKNAPGNGLSASFWIQEIGPVQIGGLATTSARMLVQARVYTSMLSEPQDAIDPKVMDAVDLLMASYSEDFDLNGQIRNVDLLGQFGVPLQAVAGFLTQDGKAFRIMTITIPLVINDVWNQVA